MAQTKAKKRGFSDVLYLDSATKQNLEEVSSCNIFIAKVLFFELFIFSFSITVSVNCAHFKRFNKITLRTNLQPYTFITG